MIWYHPKWRIDFNYLQSMILVHIIKTWIWNSNLGEHFAIFAKHTTRSPKLNSAELKPNSININKARHGYHLKFRDSVYVVSYRSKWSLEVGLRANWRYNYHMIEISISKIILFCLNIGDPSNGHNGVLRPNWGPPNKQIRADKLW